MAAENIKKVTLTKRDQDSPVFQLIAGDRQTSGLMLHINRYDSTRDLSELGWSIKIQNAKGLLDEQLFQPEVSDMWLTYTWMFPAICASEIGRTAFQLEAVNADDELVWQSGKRYIDVHEGLLEPHYDPEPLTLLQQTIYAAGAKVREMELIVDEYGERVADVVARADHAVSEAEQAVETATRAAEVASEASDTIDDVVARADRAVSEAEQAVADAERVIAEADAAKRAALNAAEAANAAAGTADAASRRANASADSADDATEAAQSAAGSASAAASSARTAASNANTATDKADAATAAATRAAENANTAAGNAVTNINNAIRNANTAAESASTAAQRAANAADAANNAKDALAGWKSGIDETVSALSEDVNAANVKNDEQDAAIDGLSNRCDNATSAVEALEERVDNIGEVITEVVEPLQKQADDTERRLDALWKLNQGQVFDFEEKVESGLNDAPSGAKYMTLQDVRGKSEQDSTNGYQMFDRFAKNDYICTYSTDGWIRVNNNSNYTLYPQITYNLPAEEIDYAVAVDIRNPKSVASGAGLFFDISGQYRNGLGINGDVSRRTANVKRSGNVRLMLSIPSGYDAEIRIMLERGTEFHDYEPYTGGVASPNPDYPQEIHSVEEINVKVVGRNLWNTEKLADGYMAGGSNVGSISSSGDGKSLTEYIKLNGNRHIYWYGEGDLSNYANRIATYDADKNPLGLIQPATGTGTIGIKEMPVGTEYIRCSFAVGINNPMVCVGNIAYDYEPYHEESRTIVPLRALNAIGDNMDTCDIESGVWEYALDSEIMDANVATYSASQRSGVYIKSRIANAQADKLCVLSDKLKGTTYREFSSTKLGLCQYINSNRILFKPSSEFADTNAVKAWVRENNPMIVYTLSEKESEPINADDLAFLRSLSMISADHNITLTDQDGNDVSYLMEYIVKLSEVV